MVGVGADIDDGRVMTAVTIGEQRTHAVRAHVAKGHWGEAVLHRSNQLFTVSPLSHSIGLAAHTHRKGRTTVNLNQAAGARTMSAWFCFRPPSIRAMIRTITIFNCT